MKPDPIGQFSTWFEEAQDAGVPVPEAMTLATASATGSPSARMVLLKGFDDRGFVFHTSYVSRKGRELAENPSAALVFYWRELGRQVRVEGDVARVPAQESAEYFGTRPTGGRVSAWASPQSEVIESRAALEAAFERLSADYEGREIPLPPFWGGFRLTPAVLEFWQHRESRLHDRFRYRRAAAGWVVERLSP